MKAKIKLWYSNHRNIINTTKFAATSILLIVLVWFLDVKDITVKSRIPQFLLLSVDVSRTFLSTLAGVFLTVATFTFTTILTVMTTYSSNFTPRVVQRFINKPHVLSLIGIFIGGFFYSVLSLFIMQYVPDGQKVLSGSLGVVYAITSMIVFLLFVQQVIRDIRVVNLIQDIYDEAFTLVEAEAEQRKNAQRFGEDKISKTIGLHAAETGYFYDVDLEGLMKKIKGIPCEVIIHKKIGEYISKGVYIADLNLTEDHLPEEIEDEEGFTQDISQCFLLNKAKNVNRDYHYEIITLIEIALKAISPGINDPNTAINCIGKISNLLGRLFATKNKFIVTRSGEKAKVIYTAYSVEEELYLTFYQLLFYGKEDPSVAQAILQGLNLIYMIADDSAKDSVREFFDYAYEVTYSSMSTDYDKKHIEEIKDSFLKNKDEECNETAIRE